ncbi:MAG: FAD-binding protein [Ruthenibacterium lactatiformans]
MRFDLPAPWNNAAWMRFGTSWVRNMCTDDYAPSVAYGKTRGDILRLRNQVVENVPTPCFIRIQRNRSSELWLTARRKDRFGVYGGGSSVTRGVECMKGGISLDMRLRFNKVAPHEVDQTITVEAGMSGPKLRTRSPTLPDAGRKAAYTCGHFPQSFEHSPWAAGSSRGRGRTAPTTAASAIL